VPVDLENLPETVEELKAIIKSEIPKREEQIKQRDSQIHLLKDQVKSLRHQLWGRKSEKLSPEEFQQSRLFNEAEETISLTKKETAKIHVKSHDRKKPGGRKPFPENLPREEIILDIPDEDKHCDCGHDLKKIGEDITEKAEIIPAKIVIKKYIRPKYACSHCKGNDMDGSAVKTAPVQPEILPKSRVTAGFMAWSLDGKFMLHLPFYRQEQILKSLGVDINRDDLSRYASRIGRVLDEKVLPLMWKDLLHSPVIGADETPFDILIRPDTNKKKIKQVYMHVYHGSGPPMVLFKYHPSRKTEFMRELLRDFKGSVMTDDYAGYNWMHDPGSQIQHQNCMATKP
jgi:transposase